MTVQCIKESSKGSRQFYHWVVCSETGKSKRQIALTQSETVRDSQGSWNVRGKEFMSVKFIPFVFILGTVVRDCLRIMDLQ